MSLTVAIRHRLGGMSLDVAFDAPDGVTAFFGRSGAGKTSVVNAVAGLLRPDSGKIVLNGRDLVDSGSGTHVPINLRNVGYVFQDARLFPHLSVRKNLLYGARTSTGLDRISGMLGIDHLLSRRPRSLSGGEAQRVAIGRALLSEPELLIMDEPLAALDFARKAEILPYLERLRDEAGLPILYVSHSIEEVARLATTLVLMADGRVVSAGPAEALFADPSLVPFFGPRAAGALLPGRVVAQHDDGMTEIAVSSGSLFLPKVAVSPGAQLRVRIEAQDVMLAITRPENVSALNILPAVVKEVHPGQGPGVMVQLQAGEDLLLARITRRSADALRLAPGCACFAVLKSVAVSRGNVGHG